MTSNANVIAKAIEEVGTGVMPAVDQVVDDYSDTLLGKIKRNASGRPGPRQITGDYVRSWLKRLRRTRTGSVVDLGTNAPQARRLEDGFFDTDSLGRVYRQRAYPHVRPAVNEVRQPFRLAVSKAVQDVVRKHRAGAK